MNTSAINQATRAMTTIIQSCSWAAEAPLGIVGANHSGIGVEGTVLLNCETVLNGTLLDNESMFDGKKPMEDETIVDVDTLDRTVPT